MNKNLYCQCTLERPHFGGFIEQTAWIPAKYAVVGKKVRLRENGLWGEICWEVTSAGQPRHIDEIPDAHAEVKAHRQRTGDSLPKRKNNDS